MIFFEDELFKSTSWPDRDTIDALARLNDRMKDASGSEDWTPLIAFNREFHWRIYSFSAFKLIQDELFSLRCLPRYVKCAPRIPSAALRRWDKSAAYAKGAGKAL